MDLGVGGAGADLKVVAEPGGAGESGCQLAIGRLTSGFIQRPNDTAD
jgi:hypothetical protein